MRNVVYFLLVLFHAGLAYGQDRCGTVEHTNQLLEKNSIKEKNDDFEKWLSEKKAKRALKVNALDGSTVYQIPVVVHILHKGESVRSGTNLSVEQIQSQLKVLNEDFKRLNSDTLNTPDEFKAVAGKINFEFVLAKQNPDGELSTGIIRVRGSKNTWSINDDATLKAQSYWPAENYLNIWVTDLSTTLLGYAQFPVSDLVGLEEAEDNRLTDGVVIDYSVFGSNKFGDFNLNASFNNGRTTVHEIGHFFGLRHIWGDDNGSCNGSGDYVSDTPNQSDYTDGCPSHPYTTCNAHTMFQNYMDYTNDACMNLFTEGQVSRMITVIENSPRRLTLTSSPGLEDPTPVVNDLGIELILSPMETICSNEILPSIEIINNGTNVIASAVVKLSIDLVEQESKTVNLSLAPGEVTTIDFDSHIISEGSHAIGFEILQTNGQPDGKSSDNADEITIFKPYSISLPFSEPFNSIPSNWHIDNPDQETTWAVRNAPDGVSSNKAIYMNFYNSETDEAEDKLITPVFNLSEASNPYLIFDVAYASRSNRSDGLKIYVLKDCEDIDKATKIYDKGGDELATVTSVTQSFVPSGYFQWRREVIDLSKFIGKANVQIAFVGISDSGNNLYVDDISVVKDLQEKVSLTATGEPSPVRCNNESGPVLTVNNNGSVAVSSFLILYSLNEGDYQREAFDEMNVLPGDHVEVRLPQVTLSDGENVMHFRVVEPNHLVDLDSTDNAITITSVVNASIDKLPLRENFNADFESWIIVNPQQGMTWKTIQTNYERSLFFDAFDNEIAGDEAWVVSPSLDLSEATEASVFFDLSYRSREAGDENDKIASDSFRVLLSKDCGSTYPDVLWEASGSSLSGATSSTEWLPVEDAHWFKTFIDLTAYAGLDNVRLAFVATNANGNNLYLDNIEFFLSSNPSPYMSTELYTIYGTTPSGSDEFFITFNLPEREPVQYELVDMMGRQVAQNQLTDVLNQTFTISTEALSQGVYIMRLRINDAYYSQKIYAGR